MLSQFGDSSTWLVLLKYLGLGLAAGSSIWGTVSELTVAGKGGRKRLTTAGRISIALTLGGLVISIVSEDIQRQIAAKAQRAENRRTNDIVIAGQRLTSLSLAWILQGLDADLVGLLNQGAKDAEAFIDDQQGERDGQQNGAVYREKKLYPFLVALSRKLVNESARDGTTNVVALLALNDDQSAVLPFGFLDQPRPWTVTRGSVGATHKSPSLEIGSHADAGNSDLLSWPEISLQATNATLAWRADPSTFAASLARQNDAVVPTAKLPEVVRIALVFNIKSLPFSANNFAIAEDQDFWKFPDYQDTQNSNPRGAISPTPKGFTSSVRLIPNNSTVVAYDYTLSRIYETLFRDSYGEADTDVRGLVFEYKLNTD